MAKAEEYASNSYSYNVMFMVDESKSDDVNLKVLVVDTTGAFDGQKYNDPTTPSTPSGKTYAPNSDTTVKVADSDVVTGAAATYNTKDGKMTVQLTVAKSYTTKHDDKITVTVNGVKQTATIGTLADGTLQLTVNCDKGDKVVVNVDTGAFTA